MPGICNNSGMLEANALACRRGGRTLFRQLSFTLSGGALRVAGANGAGKTSLLRILCGLADPAEGEVRWKGTAIRRLREEYSRELVYLGHAPAVKDELTPAENLDIALRLSGKLFPKEQIEAALAAYGVPDLPARKLSQGQRRRAALARLILAGHATLWLLDEPFTALDAAAVRFTEELIERHAASGGAAVYTTHQPCALDAAATVIELG